MIDVRKPKSFIKGGFIPEHETAIIIHGFNGTQTSQHIMYLKDGNFLQKPKFSLEMINASIFTAYISKQYNVIAGKN